MTRKMKKLMNKKVLLVLLFAAAAASVLALTSANDGSITVEGVNSAPTATATPQDGAIYLSWEPVSGAQKYRYRIKQSGGEWSSYTFVSSSTTNTTFDGLTNDTTYTVSVGTRRNDKWRNEWTEIEIAPSTSAGSNDPGSDDSSDSGGTNGGDDSDTSGGDSTPGGTPIGDLSLHDYVDEIGLSSAPKNSSSFGYPCIADINEDGILDVLWSQHKTKIINYYWGNDDYSFTEKTEQGLTKHDNHGCAVADFDKDGDLDIFGPNGACQGTCLKRDKLWLQKNNGKFRGQEWLTTESYTKDRSRNVVIFDVDNDGWEDLFVSASAVPGRVSHHRILRNKGLGNDGFWKGFAEGEYGIEQSEGNSDCAAAADFDADGFTDLIVCEEDRMWIFKNNGGITFSEYPTSIDMADVFGVNTTDINSDGQPDLLLARKTSLEVYINEAGSFGEPIYTHPLEFGYEVVTPDMNGDGKKDIYVIQALSGKDPASDSAHMLFLTEDITAGSFTRVLVPQPDRGAGDKAAVYPNFKDSNRDAVLIGNGGQWDTQGPRQVIAEAGL